MSSENTSDVFQRAWQHQPTIPTPSLGEIRRRATGTTRRVSARNTREYIAGAVLIVAITSNIVRGGFDGLTDVGNVLALLGVAYVMYQIRRRGHRRPLPSELGLTAASAFYRRELERQRDLLLSVWRWYLLPLVPGLVVSMAARWLQQPTYGPRALLTLAAATVLFPFIMWLNRRAAARLQRAIDALG